MENTTNLQNLLNGSTRTNDWIELTTKDMFLTSDERFDIWNVKQAERPHLALLEERIEERNQRGEVRQIEKGDFGNTTEFLTEERITAPNPKQCHGEDASYQFKTIGRDVSHPNTSISKKIDDNERMDDKSTNTVASTTSTSSNCNSLSSSSGQLPLIDGCDIPGWRRHGLIEVSSYLQGILHVGSGCCLTRRLSQIPVLSTLGMRNWDTLLRENSLLQPPTRTARRLTSDETSKLTFHPWFERQNIPAILEGCCDEWNAMTNCTWMKLVERFGSYEWRFSDTHGATMTLSTYHKYVNSIEGQTDDAPLAVYDSQLDNDDRIVVVQEDYNVPHCFNAPDLFECLDDKRLDGGYDAARPPYRWILMGPARSGTGLHIDPLGTHAWVSLIEGLKRWVLFPYGTDPKSIGLTDNPNERSIPSVIWFQQYYQKCIQQHPDAVEILQRPGETVYVPAGWPHLVLNLKASVAITQNYATEYPTLQRFVHAIQREEPDLMEPWLYQLQSKRPDLATQVELAT